MPPGEGIKNLNKEDIQSIAEVIVGKFSEKFYDDTASVKDIKESVEKLKTATGVNLVELPIFRQGIYKYMSFFIRSTKFDYRTACDLFNYLQIDLNDQELQDTLMGMFYVGIKSNGFDVSKLNFFYKFLGDKFFDEMHIGNPSVFSQILLLYSKTDDLFWMNKFENLMVPYLKNLELFDDLKSTWNSYRTVLDAEKTQRLRNKINMPKRLLEDLENLEEEENVQETQKTPEDLEEEQK